MRKTKKQRFPRPRDCPTSKVGCSRPHWKFWKITLLPEFQFLFSIIILCTVATYIIRNRYVGIRVLCRHSSRMGDYLMLRNRYPAHVMYPVPSLVQHLIGHMLGTYTWYILQFDSRVFIPRASCNNTPASRQQCGSLKHFTDLPQRPKPPRCRSFSVALLKALLSQGL